MTNLPRPSFVTRHECCGQVLKCYHYLHDRLGQMVYPGSTLTSLTEPPPFNKWRRYAAHFYMNCGYVCCNGCRINQWEKDGQWQGVYWIVDRVSVARYIAHYRYRLGFWIRRAGERLEKAIG